MRRKATTAVALLAIGSTISACNGEGAALLPFGPLGSSGSSGSQEPAEPSGEGSSGEQAPDGEAAVGQDAVVSAVYVMTNETDANRVMAYGAQADGSLSVLGSYETGGVGTSEFDGGEGLDPLISAYAVEKTPDNRFVFATNAGSDTLSAFAVQPDFSLERTALVDTDDEGPNSVAVFGSYVYVSNITRPGFVGEPDHEGSLKGFILGEDGSLTSLGAPVDLANRPSSIRFSPRGDYLVVASINAGSPLLENDNNDELAVYRVKPDGTLWDAPVSTARSTEVNNSAGRNLASAIGFEIVEDSTGRDIVVVTEAREFQADGAPPAFPALQNGSVSTFVLGTDGQLTPLELDIEAVDGGSDGSFTDGDRTACWIAFSEDQDYFWVSNAIDASLSSFGFGDDGSVELIEGVAAVGTPATSAAPAEAFGQTDGWIDLDVSDDGQYLYQLYGLDGTVGVFRIDGAGLELVQELEDTLPEVDTQGIIAVGPVTEPAPVGAVFSMTNGLEGNEVVAYSRAANGELSFVGSYETGGLGSTEFDGGEGLDPLISAYSIELSDDNRFVLAVNAGSDSLSVLRVGADSSLELVDVVSTVDAGPNSIAIDGSLVYVSNITREGDEEFAGEPDQEGSLQGYRLGEDGSLQPLGAPVDLNNRPSSVRFSTDGKHLVVSSINAGSPLLENDNNDELVVYAVYPDGSLSQEPTGSARSTDVDNDDNRNLASAIGFEVVPSDNGDIVVVTEAREFRANGAPPVFPGLQNGSVSTFRLESDGSLSPMQLDVQAADDPDGSFTDGDRTACWITVANDYGNFWVSNAIDASISSFTYDVESGYIGLAEAIAAQGNRPTSSEPSVAFGQTDGWIDLDISDDGSFVYQLYGLSGTIGVFRVRGGELELIQEVSGQLPLADTQGIIAF